MKKIFALLAALFAAGLTTPALAGSSDLFNWTGFYVGADAGGIFGHATYDVPATSIGGPVSPNGFLGGGHAGIRSMVGGLVVGAEAEMWWSGASQTKAVSDPGFTLDGTLKLRSGGSAQLQIGVPVNNTLFFVTGGWSYINTTGCLTNSTCDTSNIAGFKDTRTGWVVGGGAERALSANWSVRLVYLHADYGSNTFTLNSFVPPSQVSLNHFTTDTMQFGVTYNFGL